MSGDGTAVALIDPEELARSLTGFEEIAVEQRFRRSLASMGEDSTMAMRMLLFVAQKRSGMKDADAFRAVMEMPLSDVVARFRAGDEAGDDDQGEA